MTEIIAQGASSDELEALRARRPINWDELGSSAKDLWVERQLRSIRKTALRR